MRSFTSAFRSRLFILLLAILSLGTLGAAPPEVAVETLKLDNGLTVLLQRDDRIPVVAVEVRYLVGSAHEKPGKTGFAHLFEHLMFQGSKNYDQEYFAPFEPIGGSVNGTTNTDRTNYYERVPANYLELALWLESDRMGGLLDVLTQAKLDNQREVVKNERRQRYENAPYGMMWIHLHDALYPAGHPYHHTTIGSHEDLTAASLDDVRSFFRQHYVPANAVLTIVGDFEPKATMTLVEKYFGGLPGGAKTSWPNVPAVTPTAKHVVERDDVKLPRVYLAWHTPALYAQGDAEMDVLASVLSRGKSSRLYKPLVYEQRVAKDVSAYQVSRALGSTFIVQATAAPGTTEDELHQALTTALTEALATAPSDEELTRARNGWEKSFYGLVEDVLSRARLLSTYHHLTGNADYLQTDLERYTKLSAVDVHAAAQKYLLLDKAVRLDILPEDGP